MLDLIEAEKRIDDLLENETSESLITWLYNKRLVAAIPYSIKMSNNPSKEDIEKYNSITKDLKELDEIYQTIIKC